MFTEYPVLGIDIGAHTVKCAVGVRNEQSGVIDIIASSMSPTDGMHEGRVANPEVLSMVIQQCIDRAVLYAMCVPREALICTSGYHCFSMDAQTQVSVREGQVSHAHVVQLVEAAAAWDFVKQLPDGINTQIGERGVRLSQGEKQRLTIARVLAQPMAPGEGAGAGARRSAAAPLPSLPPGPPIT